MRPAAEPPAPEPPPEGPKPGRNLSVAIVTGLTLAGLLFATLFTHRFAFFVLVTAAIMIALSEFYGVLAAKGYRPATPVGMVVGLAILTGAYWRGPQAVSFGLVLAVIGSFLWYLADPNRGNVIQNIAGTVFGVAYVPVLAAHVILMRDLRDGPAIVISFIGITALYDVAAYASGSLFGTHKIAPGISPSKTWEGAAGASVFVFALALVAGPHIGPFTVGSAAALAAATALVAPAGDLAESLLKRDLDVKDFGRLLPGHGGLLDRIDALLLMAPVAYWLARGLLA